VSYSDDIKDLFYLWIMDSLTKTQKILIAGGLWFATGAFAYIYFTK